MKQHMPIIAAGIVCLATLVSHAATETVDGITWTYTVSGNKATLSGSSSVPCIPKGTTGAITIPATLGGNPVTSIGNYAFQNCSGLTAVTIPSGVTSIGNYAFQNCNGLTAVTIPDSVKSINTYAFSGCSGLTSVTIPSGVTSIGNYVFQNCSGLTSVAIPDSVKSIGSSAFSGCSGLTSMTIPDSVTSIDSSSFSGCRDIVSFSVGTNNPSFCSVNGLLLSKNGEALIRGVKGAVTIPNGVTSIGANAFSGCSGLTSVTIPSGVTSIGSSAFSGCSGLTSVQLPDSVTSIGSSAFSGCSGLTSVTIPNGVMIIGERLFYNCGSLTSVTIPDSVTSIGGYAFYNCGGLTSVTIPDLVTSIGGYAFYNCSGLTSVTIPDLVTSIGNYAFYNCSGLTSVTIPDLVTSIGGYAFAGCAGLTSVSIGNGVTSIGGQAFQNCSRLSSMTIGNSVTSIGSYAFHSCNSLKSVTFLGRPPVFGNSMNSMADIPAKTFIYVSEQDGAEWRTFLASQSRPLMGYLRSGPRAEILSAAMRQNDPTIMDVTYRVVSETNTPVNVRALAFVDGTRSFAKVVRPETFVEGTTASLGDGISVNEEHRVSWRVSADWNADLEFVTFEVFVAEQGRLPLELTTIPAAGEMPAIQFSWNGQLDSDVLNALFWHYANREEDLELANGVLSSGGNILATDGHLGNSSSANKQYATQYVFGKMGYTLLAGDALTWVNQVSRLSLAPSAASQHAVKIMGDFSRTYDRPGLLQATISSSSLDTATDVASLSCRRELGPVMAFTTASYASPLDGATTAWANNTQFIYRGQIYLEAGTTYTFGANIDDWDYIKIDGTVVIRDTSASTFDTGTFTCAETGWHDIDIRIGNVSGSAGRRSPFIGIGYNTTGLKTVNNGNGWTQLVDPGDGSLLRTMGVTLLFPLSN